MQNLITIINTNTIDVVTYDGYEYKLTTYCGGVNQDGEEVFEEEDNMLDAMGWHNDWKKEADIFYNDGKYTKVWGFIV